MTCAKALESTVFLNWAWAYFIYGLGARLITGRRRRGAIERKVTELRPDLTEQ